MAKQPRVWTGTQWDTLAVTLPDLSNYSTTTQMNTAIGANAGLNLINTTTFSGSSSISVNNCFSSTYQAYKINLTLNSPSADNYFRFRLRANGTDSTASYYGMKITVNALGSVGTYGDNNASSVGILNMDSGASGTLYSSFIDIINPFVAAKTTWFINSTNLTFTGDPQSIFGGNLHDIATSYDGFTIYPDAGTVSGTVRVYGYRNS